MAKRIIKPDSGNTLVLQEDNGSIDALTVETTGDVTLAGKLIIDPTKGIQFRTSTGGSGAFSSGILDDYEEGTWTPAITYATPGTLSVGYSDRYAYYTKIGNVCYFVCDIRLSSFSKGTASGNLQISGFPFSSKNQSNYARPNSVPVLYSWNYSTTAGYQPIFSMMQNGNTYGELAMMRPNTTSVSLDDPSSSSLLFLSGWYYTS